AISIYQPLQVRQILAIQARRSELDRRDNTTVSQCSTAYPVSMNADAQKRAAAARAVEFVRPGMRLGLGTGSTAKHFIELIGERVHSGLDIVAVPTSEVTFADAKRCGIPLTTLDEAPALDLTVDGADEIGPGLCLIKGGGGALLREKIVAAASERMIVIADQSKSVEQLGHFPLPIEVSNFGLAATMRSLKKAIEG